MSEPKNLQEYLERFANNNTIEGYGIGNVYMTVPCPFCAAPNFIKYEVLQVRQAMEEEHICSECQRGAKALFQDVQGGTQFEIVQTTGPDQPEWLQPKMRRV